MIRPVAARVPRLDVLFFDIDDTLYATTVFASHARRNAMKAMIAAGLKLGEDEAVAELSDVVAEFTGNYEHHFDQLLERLGPAFWGGQHPAMLVAAAVTAYHNTTHEELRLLPDAAALIEALRARRFKMGVITSGLKPKQAEKLVRLGLTGVLHPEALCFSEQVGVSKPNPKLYAKACAGVGVHPSRAMYVGDRLAHDVAPAKQVGMRTVHYTGAHGRWCGEPCPTVPDHALSDLRELLPILEREYGIG